MHRNLSLSLLGHSLAKPFELLFNKLSKTFWKNVYKYYYYFSKYIEILFNKALNAP